MPKATIKTKVWGNVTIEGSDRLIKSIIEYGQSTAPRRGRKPGSKTGYRNTGKKTVVETVMDKVSTLKGPWTPAQIMKTTGVKRPSLAKALATLLEEGKIAQIRKGKYETK